MIRLRREAHELVVAYSEKERLSYQEAVQALIQKGAGVKPLGQRLAEVDSQEVARREKLASQQAEVASQRPTKMTVVPDAPEPKRPQQFKLADGRMFTDLSRVKRADDEATAPTQRFSPAINAEPVHEAADAAGADDVAEDAPAFSTAPPPSKFQQQNDKPEPRVDLRGVIKPREIDPDMPFLDGEPDVHGWRNEAGR